MSAMRAKMQIQKIEKHHGGIEVLHLSAVARSSAYPPDGSDEDNTYAKFTPSGQLTLTIANPALIGKFSPGEKYYVDFSLVPA